MILTKFALALVSVTTAVSGSLPSHNARDESWLADHLEHVVTGSAAYGHLQELQQAADGNGGIRATGTGGFRASADYVVERLEHAGYRVTRQPVPYQDFHFDAEHVTESAGGAGPIRTYMVRYSPSTPEGGITAPLVVLPADRGPTAGCDPADYAGLAVRDAVVVAPRSSCGLVHQHEVAAEVGARALLLYRVTPRPDNLYRVQLIGTDTAQIPLAMITQRRAEALAAEAAHGPVTLRLDLRGHRVTGTTENILAETAGGRPDRVVMVGAHLDSVTEGPGINDNASSCAAVLETALKLAPLQHRVVNKVRFAFWGAEELITVGSQHYVDTLSTPQRRDIALYLNYELLAGPNFARFVMDGDGSANPGPPGSGAVKRVVAAYYAQHGLAYETDDISHIGSDHEPFMAAGIPIGGFYGGTYGTKTADQARRYGGVAGDMYDPCYHQSCDTVANINRPELDRNVRGVAWTVGRFAIDVDDVRGDAP